MVIAFERLEFLLHRKDIKISPELRALIEHDVAAMNDPVDTSEVDDTPPMSQAEIQEMLEKLWPGSYDPTTPEAKECQDVLNCFPESAPGFDAIDDK